MTQRPNNVRWYSPDKPFLIGNVSMYFRITYVHYDQRNNKCFIRGTVDKRDTRNMYTEISQVKVNTTCSGLPTLPTKGEYWQVYGKIEYYTETKYNSVKHIFHYKEPQSLEFMMPNTLEEVTEFISKSDDFPMIGASRLFNIWHKYKDQALNIIMAGDIEKLTAVDLISEENAITLVEGFKKYENLKYAPWFTKHRIPPMIQHNFFKMTAIMELQVGEEPIEVNMPSPPEVISENPYLLASLGMKFTDIDNLALSTFNKRLDDKNRLVALVNKVLSEDILPRGHTFAYYSQILPRLQKIVDSKELAELALQQSERMLNFRRGDDGKYHHGALYLMEQIIAQRVSTLLKRKTNWIDLYTKATNRAIGLVPFPLAAKQVEAIFSALENEISIISGGAGTGKTTVLRTVVKVFYELGYTVHGITLSGRAALRLFESIKIPTKTITRFLSEPDLRSADAKGNPRRHLVIIDESSMVDTQNMSRIVTHTCPDVRFLIVGDVEQLAPIGAGKILYDLIKSGVVPYVELDQVQRQKESTGIPEYSRIIRSGKVPELLSFKNIHFHECHEAKIVDKCVRIYQQNRSQSQIISATRKTTSELNVKCQSMFNAHSAILTYEYMGRTIKSDFHLFDPVIFTKNHATLGIQNGLLGNLSSIRWNANGYGGVKIQESKELISLTPQLITELQLAYGITLHKAQGSQFPVVIVALENSSLIDRSWLYTAITRAEVEVHIVGSKTKFVQAVTCGNKGHLRQTYLKELIHRSLIL